MFKLQCKALTTKNGGNSPASTTRCPLQLAIVPRTGRRHEAHPYMCSVIPFQIFCFGESQGEQSLSKRKKTSIKSHRLDISTVLSLKIFGFAFANIGFGRFPHTDEETLIDIQPSRSSKRLSGLTSLIVHNAKLYSNNENEGNLFLGI